MIETKTGFWAERLGEAFGRPLECTPIGLLGGEAQKGLPYGLAIAAGFAQCSSAFSHTFSKSSSRWFETFRQLRLREGRGLMRSKNGPDRRDSTRHQE